METKIRLELTMQQINVILAGVSKLPIEMALGTFDEIRSQADVQLKVNNSVSEQLVNKDLLN